MNNRFIMRQLKWFGWSEKMVRVQYPEKVDRESLLMNEIWADGFYTAKGEKSKWKEKGHGK